MHLLDDDGYPYHYFNFAAYNELGPRLEKRNPILTGFAPPLSFTIHLYLISLVAHSVTQILADYIGYIHNVEKVKEFGGATGNKVKLRNIGIRNLK